jgi:hypothetical protein
MLGACLEPHAAIAAICWLLCCNCLLGFDATNHSQVRAAGRNLTASTHSKQAYDAFTMLCKAVQNKPKLQLGCWD